MIFEPRPELEFVRVGKHWAAIISLSWLIENRVAFCTTCGNAIKNANQQMFVRPCPKCIRNTMYTLDVLIDLPQIGWIK